MLITSIVWYKNKKKHKQVNKCVRKRANGLNLGHIGKEFKLFYVCKVGVNSSKESNLINALLPAVNSFVH